MYAQNISWIVIESVGSTKSPKNCKYIYGKFSKKNMPAALSWYKVILLYEYVKINAYTTPQITAPIVPKSTKKGPNRVNTFVVKVVLPDDTST